MKRRNFLKNTSTFSLLCLSPGYIGDFLSPEKIGEAYSAALPELFMPDLIPFPENPEEWPKFRESLLSWRKDTKAKLNYSDKLYNNPDFKWVSSAFNCYFLMMYDEQFYDQKTSAYKVDEFVDRKNSCVFIGII